MHNGLCVVQVWSQADRPMTMYEADASPSGEVGQLSSPARPRLLLKRSAMASYAPGPSSAVAQLYHIRGNMAPNVS